MLKVDVEGLEVLRGAIILFRLGHVQLANGVTGLLAMYKEIVQLGTSSQRTQ